MATIGVNLDPGRGGVFKPSEADLQDFDTVRFVARPHADFIGEYPNKTVIAVLNHQTWGEHDPERTKSWEELYDDVEFWKGFAGRFSRAIKPLLERHANRKRVWWQIWNEPDMRIGAGASVPMSVDSYEALVHIVSDTIDQTVPGATILSAGFASGADSDDSNPHEARPKGLLYAKAAWPHVDKIAHHVYADNMSQESQAYRRLGKPTVVTETGFVKSDGISDETAAKRATRFREQGAKSDVIVWYPWVHGMDGAFGPIFESGERNQLLYNALTGGNTRRPAPDVQPNPGNPRQGFTNQQFINALLTAAERKLESGSDFSVWFWLRNEGLNFVLDRPNRNNPYQGPAIAELHNLPQPIFSELQRILA